MIVLGTASSARPRCALRPGVTLIEVLIVIAIVGVLVGLSALGLSHARRAARTAADLSNLRSHVQAFAVYHTAWDGQFPVYTRRDADVTIIRPPWGHGAVGIAGYFAGRNMWPLALADTLYQGRWDSSGFLSAHNPVEYAYTDFHFDQSYLADPKYWARETRAGRPQWRAIRAHEVRHPASKSVFVNTYRPNDPATIVSETAGFWDIAFVDGSARSIGADRIAPGYPSGGCCDPCGIHPVDTGCGQYRPPATCTVHGVRGQDVR